MKKMNAEKLVNFVIGNVSYFVMAGSFAMSFFIQRVGVTKPESGDWLFSYQNWLQAIEGNGLCGSISDYPAGWDLILLLLIKCNMGSYQGLKWFCWLFNVIMAVSVYSIVSKITLNKENASFAFSGCLMLPSIVLNTSDWGQVDAVYVSLIQINQMSYFPAVGNDSFSMPITKNGTFKMAVAYPWPGSMSAEVEVIQRMKKAAEENGFECIAVDNHGNCLNEDCDIPASDNYVEKTDCVISAHYLTPKLIDSFY